MYVIGQNSHGLTPCGTKIHKCRTSNLFSRGERWFVLTPRACGGRTLVRPVHSRNPPLRGSTHGVAQQARCSREHVRLRASVRPSPSSSCVPSGMATANWALLSESAAAHSTTRATTVPRTAPDG